MTAPIGPGDYVECIHAGFDERSPLTVGAVYTVTKVMEDNGFMGFLLKEVAPPPGFTGFLADLFKPIYRRDESLINRLMAPLPAEPDLVSA